MKSKLLCALVCSFLSCAAYAQNGEVRVAEYNSSYMVVVDVDTVMPVKGYYWAWTAIYLARSQSGLAAHAKVDYLAIWGEYDCNTRATWRPMTTLSYASGKKEPVAEDRGQINPWERATFDSPGYYSWKAVCQKVFTDLEVESFHTSDSRPAVLLGYRNLLRRGL